VGVDRPCSTWAVLTVIFVLKYRVSVLVDEVFRHHVFELVLIKF
jgi:hypothetical protein